MDDRERETEKILADYAARLAGMERALGRNAELGKAVERIEAGLASHTRVCPTGWTRLLLTVVFAVIGFFVLRIYTEQDTQNKAIHEAAYERKGMLAELSFLRGAWSTMHGRDDKQDERIRALEDDKRDRDARREYREQMEQRKGR